jgi:hypothetical protein
MTRLLILIAALLALCGAPAFAQTQFGPVTPTSAAGSPRTDKVSTIQGCPTCTHIGVDQGAQNAGGASNGWFWQGIETAGSALTGSGVRAMGSDGTYARDLLTDAAGRQIVDVYSLPAITGSVTSAQGAQAATGTAATGWWYQGIETAGSALTGGGTRVMGSDGTYARDLLTDTAGREIIVGSVSSGAADVGSPVKTGCVYNSTQPTVTTGERVDCQADANGNNRVVLASSPNIIGATTGYVGYNETVGEASVAAGAATPFTYRIAPAWSTVFVCRVYSSVSGTATIYETLAGGSGIATESATITGNAPATTLPPIANVGAADGVGCVFVNTSGTAGTAGVADSYKASS